MISRSAISQYLARPAENFVWMKSLPEQELDEMLSEIRPTVHPNVFTLNTAQKVCFILGVAYGQFVFHLSMGVGKTRLTLELLRWYIKANKMKCGIILANTDEVVSGWEDEIIKWQIDIPYKLLLGSNREKWHLLDKLDTGLAIATHTGFATMSSSKVTREKLTPTGEKKPVTHFEPERERIDYLSSKFDAFVWDESTKAIGKLFYKVSRTASAKAPIRFALAGRLFGRDPMPVWPQFNLVDHGESFGTTLGLFREVFFKAKRGYFGGMEYTFDKKREPEFQKFLGHRSIYYDVDEVMDLPELTRIPKYCSMPGDTVSYYQQCIDEIIRAKKNHRVIANSFIRMRQISSGFVGLIDEDNDSERSVIEFDQNPKLDLLMDLLSDLPDNRKCVIFHEFTWSGQQICNALTKAKIQYGWLHGGTTDWESLKNKFNNNPSFRHLVVGWRKGGYGLNLQAANYGFFYESPVSVIDREQCERRLSRQGQRWPVFLFDLMMRKTVDPKILDFHREGRDIFQSLAKDPSQLLLDLEAAD
jgi:helicase-like protein/type III restriction/modification enzyme restriction subunit